jgi:eukaryotic-like serine/threonine-protein kinase
MKTCHTCQQTYADEMEFCPRDGSRLAAQATPTEDLLAAGLSRRFRLVRRLGAGGMGTVFLAEQIGVGNRPVALKVLNRRLLDDPQFLLRFQNEAGSTGRINHGNVVTIYESAQADDGTPYIAMQYLDGESLRLTLQRRGALPLPEVTEILQQTARGLNAAHKLGIIHRDLKPDNIFLTHDDDNEVLVKIVDFGIAKLRESATHTMTGMVLGTPAYMSYEQASGMRSDELDLRSDIYSLGVVVYEMLSGRAPFHSDTPVGYLRKHLLEEPPPFRAIAPDLGVPPAVEKAVMRALAKERDQRYAAAIDFARAFVAAVQPVRAPEIVSPTATTQIAVLPAVQEPIAPLRAIASTPPAATNLVATPPPAPLQSIEESPSVQPQRSTSSAATAEPPRAMNALEMPPSPQVAKEAKKAPPIDGLKYVWIPAGTFLMGCSPGDQDSYDEEKPPHQVTITNGFWLGQTPVTVGAYKRFAVATGRSMPRIPDFNPHWGKEQMPIVNVSWSDAHAYCIWAGGRLPSEAEWEHAARAGGTEALYRVIDDTAWSGGTISRLASSSFRPAKIGEIAWYAANSGGRTHPVGEKLANGFGLYDMLGNVLEWVSDWFDEAYYQNSPTRDPRGPEQGQERVLRGGSWMNYPRFLRVSYRSRSDPAGRTNYIGFRCAGR